jgi:hypothetical protein
MQHSTLMSRGMQRGGLERRALSPPGIPSGGGFVALGASKVSNAVSHAGGRVDGTDGSKATSNQATNGDTLTQTSKISEIANAEAEKNSNLHVADAEVEKNSQMIGRNSEEIDMMQGLGGTLSVFWASNLPRKRCPPSSGDSRCENCLCSIVVFSSAVP